MKECHNWEEIDYVEAECPYCHMIDTHCATEGVPGVKLQCNNEACKKKFKLGEQE